MAQVEFREDQLERIAIYERSVERAKAEILLADEGAFGRRYDPALARVQLDNAQRTLREIIQEEEYRAAIRLEHNWKPRG